MKYHVCIQRKDVTYAQRIAFKNASYDWFKLGLLALNAGVKHT